MPRTVHSTYTRHTVPLGELGVGLIDSMESGAACVDLVIQYQRQSFEFIFGPHTSEVRFFMTHSVRCALSAASEIMYARPLERGGSEKPRSFCLSLKFASIERYNVLIQLERND
jgi:hypothetical protein